METKHHPIWPRMFVKKHAKSHSEEYPEDAKTVLESMYMDDVMKSVSNVEKAVGLWHDLTELLGLAGIKIRKWCSKCPRRYSCGRSSW